MIQQDVSFDAALGPAELGPREQRQAQRNGGRVQRQQFILEAELVFARTQALLVAKPRQGSLEQILEQRRGPVLIGIGQRGAAGSFGNAQVHQSAEAAGQAVTNLAERIGTAELAKQHGDELSPAAKTLGGVLGAVFLHQRGELSTGKMLEQLIEKTRTCTIDWPSLWAAFGEAPRQGMARQRQL